jgi:predicted PurR-regulated permease PerM
MQLLVYLVVGVVLYLISDRLVRAIEWRLRRRLENRSLLFFAILLGLALVSFEAIRRFTGG